MCGLTGTRWPFVSPSVHPLAEQGGFRGRPRLRRLLGNEQTFEAGRTRLCPPRKDGVYSPEMLEAGLSAAGPSCWWGEGPAVGTGGSETLGAEGSRE